MNKLPKIFAVLSLSVCCLLGVVGCKNDVPDQNRQPHITTDEPSDCPETPEQEDGRIPGIPGIPKTPINPLPKREPEHRLPVRPLPRPRPTDRI